MDGERILLTGATGTVGSVLLEKLLRCCPEIDKIFVLLRNKDGFDIQERLQKLFQIPVSILL
jgi:fatty acyl-CoA reductase